MKTNKDQRQKYTLMKRYDKVWTQIKAKMKTKKLQLHVIQAPPLCPPIQIRNWYSPFIKTNYDAISSRKL
jgi:hypothetical protein